MNTDSGIFFKAQAFPASSICTTISQNFVHPRKVFCRYFNRRDAMDAEKRFHSRTLRLSRLCGFRWFGPLVAALPHRVHMRFQSLPNETL
jgi:hypothetical protein